MKNNKKIHFEVSERKLLLRIFDVLFVLVTLRICGKFLDLDYLDVTTTHFYYGLFLALYINIIGTIFEMYNLQVASNKYQILKSTILTTSTTVLLYLLTPIFSAELPSNRLQILLFYFAVLFALLLWRIFYVKFLASNRFVQNILLIGDKEQLPQLIMGLESADPHYRIVAYIDSNDAENEDLAYPFIQQVQTKDLMRFVKENSLFEIVISSRNTDDINVELYQQLLFLLESGHSIREYNQVYEDKTQRIPVHYITRDFYKFFPFSRSNNNQLYLVGTRIVEVIVSLIGLVIGMLLVPVLLLGNALGNRGKLFYKQERVGKNGELFTIYKFRTMIENAEAQGAMFSSPNDRRITPLGKFLRRTRIDEIPQFVNILKGEMGVIGPRPERPFFVKEISEIMPFYETRHVIKPGLTGWAQVNYSYGESIEDSLVKLQYDLYYIKHRSIFLDINIVIKTISTVLFYRGQ